MVLRTFDGRLYVIFHHPNASPRERAVIRPLDERRDGLVVLPGPDNAIGEISA